MSYLSAGENKTIDLSQNAALETVEFELYDYTTLLIGDKANLQTLKYTGANQGSLVMNGLSSIHIGNVPKLTTLELTCNSLDRLDLSGAPNLTTVDLSNQWGELPVLIRNSTEFVPINIGAYFGGDFSKITFPDDVQQKINGNNVLDTTNMAGLTYTYKVTDTVSMEVNLTSQFIAEDEAPTYDITFEYKLQNGTWTEETKQVKLYGEATPPEVIKDRLDDNFTFDKWNKEVTCATGNTTVKAIYNEYIPPFNVTYLDWDGSLIEKKENVNYGETPTPPTTPQHDGYSFVKWDKTIDNTQKSDATVNAIYEIIAFEDAGFREEIVKDVLSSRADPYGGTTTDYKIYTTDLPAIKTFKNLDTSFTTGKDKLTNLKGIEFFENLVNLQVTGRKALTTLDVSKNKKLQTLNIHGNGLTSLTLGNLPDLVMFDCSKNKLQTLDVSGCPRIGEDLLEEGLSELAGIKCYDNELTELKLGDHPNTKQVQCSKNKLETIDVKGLPALERLSCDENLLKSLDVRDNPQLEWLNCEENALPSLDTSNNQKLKTLNCMNNDISTLDLTKNPALEVLRCGRNGIQELDLNSNKALKRLECDGMDDGLKTLDLRFNTVLETLNCSSNGLTELNLTNNPLLKNISCGVNKLTRLDLSNQSKLTFLSCYSNQLTNLDLKGQKELLDLDCDYNKLERLDLTNQSKLNSLECESNRLLILDLDGNAPLAGGMNARNQEKRTIFMKGDANPFTYSMKRLNGAIDLTKVDVTPATDMTYDGTTKTLTSTDENNKAVSTYKYNTGKGNLTVELVPEYKAEVYTVTFYNDQDGVIKSEEVKKGAGATAPEPPAPTKVGSESHRFIKWDTAFDNVTRDLDIKPVYEAKKYTVNFKDWDGTTLESQTVEHGENATAPKDPTREGHTFTGWDPDVFNPVTSDKNVFATYEINKYTVIFKSWDKKDTLATFNDVVHGTAIQNPPEAPKREGYTFIGWSGDINNVTQSMTVIALYSDDSAPIAYYTVTFKDWDGTTLETQYIPWGMGAKAPAPPVREGYEFIGWDKEFSRITEDLVVTAIYKAKEYQVIFKDWNGKILKTQTVQWGKSAIAPPNPVRKGYTFTGWDKDFSRITGSLVVTATYKINKYTVVFKGWKGKHLKTQVVEYNGSATAPAAPKVDGYKFIGWDKEFSKVQKDITVYALYKNIATGEVVGAPKTGDETPIIPLMALLLLSSAGLVLGMRTVGKQKKN